MKESTIPILDNINVPKGERRSRGKLAETLKLKSISLNRLNDLKDSKVTKIKTKFIFKVYLHLFCQIILILLMAFFAFKNKTINSFLSNNKIIFYTFILLAFILFIYPLFSDQILRIIPYNYIYLLIFTISIFYIISKLLLLLSPSLVRIGAILLILEIIYLLIDSYFKKKNNDENNDEIVNSCIFIGLFLLFVSSILLFIEKISLFKIIIIFLIILSIGAYLIYDTNLILLNYRRNFEEKDYVLATMFLYIDVIQTIFELIGKFYNSFEPEKVPINKATKSMIYTGEEEYELLYNQKDEEEKKKEKERLKDERLFRNINRTISVKGIKLDPNKIIKETEKENEESDNENENENLKVKENTIQIQKEDEDDNDISFKQNLEKKLVFDNKDEEEEK